MFERTIDKNDGTPLLESFAGSRVAIPADPDGRHLAAFWDPRNGAVPDKLKDSLWHATGHMRDWRGSLALLKQYGQIELYYQGQPIPPGDIDESADRVKFALVRWVIYCVNEYLAPFFDSGNFAAKSATTSSPESDETGKTTKSAT